MRRTLGPLLLTALLVAGTASVAGCGDQTDSGTASDRSAATPVTPSGKASPGTSTGQGPAETVALISQSNAGGRVSTSPTVLSSPDAIASFAAQFHAGNFESRLQQVVEQHRPGAGRVLVAAVVALGCDVPRGVEVGQGPGGLEVTAQEVKETRQECFVPVTTVAVVDVDASLV